MGRVVINTCFGGFSLSDFALLELEKKGHELRRTDYGIYLTKPIERHDPDLIAVVQALGANANGRFANLVVVEFEGNKYIVDEYDGSESVITPDNQDWIEIE